MRPIPLNFIKQKVSFEEYIEDTGEGANYKTAIDLSNVRLEVKTVKEWRGDGYESIGNAIFYLDRVRTSPSINTEAYDVSKINLTKSSKVSFKGKTYQIVEAREKYDESGSIHHWECVCK